MNYKKIGFKPYVLYYAVVDNNPLFQKYGEKYFDEKQAVIFWKDEIGMFQGFIELRGELECHIPTEFILNFRGRRFYIFPLVIDGHGICELMPNHRLFPEESEIIKKLGQYYVRAEMKYKCDYDIEFNFFDTLEHELDCEHHEMAVIDAAVKWVEAKEETKRLHHEVYVFENKYSKVELKSIPEYDSVQDRAIEAIDNEASAKKELCTKSEALYEKFQQLLCIDKLNQYRYKKTKADEAAEKERQKKEKMRLRRIAEIEEEWSKLTGLPFPSSYNS